MRLALYGCTSSILAIGVVLSAMHQRSNFYAACIYLSKSSACMMILLNMGLIISVLFGKALQAIFFGRLRAIEVEHLYEKSWYAVTETCLAMTIFREEFDLQFIVVFTTLLFLKIFHWLCQDRVEYMEQSPSNRVTFHVRIVNLLVILLLVDCLLANHAISTTLIKGPNMMIMFGFEYTILICTIISTIGRYILNIIDTQSEQTWEGKSMYIFYLDLASDFFKLVTYLLFFAYICFNYQLPLHIIRDVYITFRSFIQKCRDLYRYRRATRNMNELYPDATAEDLSRSSDSTCIICREEMQVTDTSAEALDDDDDDNPEPVAYRTEGEQNLDQPKKLPCGHIFHFHCLRSWLERQQTCPTCRRSVLSESESPNSNNNQQAQPQPQAQPPIQQQPNHSQNNQSSSPPVYNQQQNPLLDNNNQQGSAAHSSFPPNNNPFQSWFPQPTNHLNIPGLIPLMSIPPPPLPNINTELPETLTDQDLQVLSTITREAMIKRLRLLDVVQNRIFESMQALSQALSVMPDISNISTDSSQNAPTNNESTTSTNDAQHEEKKNSTTTEKPSTSTTITEEYCEDMDESDATANTNSNASMSDRKRGKMPVYNTTSDSNETS